MNTRASQSAGIAGLCFLACALIVVLAYISTLFRLYAPTVREFLLWMMTPQFGLGLLCAFGLIGGWLCIFAWSER